MAKSPSSAMITNIWNGLNLSNDPEQLQPGDMTIADNLIFDGEKLISRPGLCGLLSAATLATLTGPTYLLLEFMNAAPEAASLLLTNNGKLYRWDTTAPTVLTEIKAGSTSLSLVSANAFAVRAGSVAVVIDGVVTPYVTDLTNAGTFAYTGLQAPTAVPASSLTDTTLDPFLDSAALWVPDTQSGTQTNRLPTGASDFSAGTGWSGNAPLTGGGWTSYTIDGLDGPSSGTPSGRSGTWVKLDDWEGISLTANITNDIISGDSTRHPKILYCQYDWVQEDTTSSDGFELTVEAIATDGTTILATAYEKFIPQYANQNNQQQHVFIADFTSLSVEIFYWNFKWGGKQGNSHSNNSVWGKNFVCYPFIPAMTAVTGTVGGEHDLDIALPVNPVSGTVVIPAANQGIVEGLVAGLTLTRDYGRSVTDAAITATLFVLTSASASFTSADVGKTVTVAGAGVAGGVLTAKIAAYTNSTTVTLGTAATTTVTGATLTIGIQDWAGYDNIAVGLGKGFLALQEPNGLSIPGLSFHLDFQVDGSSTWVSSNSVIINAAGYGSVDVSFGTLPVTLTAFRKVRIVFESNWTTPAYVTPAFAFGPITGSGNLTVDVVNGGLGADYLYNNTEVDATTDPSNIVAGVQLGLINVRESDPSPFATALQPSYQLAEGVIVFAVPVNASTTMIWTYRAGGVFTDGIPRLIAKLPVSADVPYGSDVSNPYYGWNHTTRTFTDNTPDSFLELPTTQVGVGQITGRGVPPAGAQALCIFQNRLCLAVGSNLYLSWLLTESASAILYFNLIVDDTDPNLPIKGGLYVVGGKDNDNINALTPMAGVLSIEKQRSVTIMSGNGISPFTLQSFLTNQASGSLAARAAIMAGNRAWWLGPNGIQQFDADIVVYASEKLQRGLNPSQTGGTPIPAEYYAACAMIYAQLRIFLAAPKSATSTANDCIYVYDTRERGIERSAGGWLRWLLPSWLTGVTTFCSLGSASATDDLYIGGNDGQIYQVTGQGDVQDSTVHTTPVPVVCEIAAWGMGDTAGQSIIQQKVGAWYISKVTTKEDTTLTLGVICENPAYNWSMAYGVKSGVTNVYKDVPATTRGDFLVPSLSWSTVTRTRFDALGLALGPGRVGA